MKEYDCKTLHYKTVSRNDKKENFSDSFEDTIYSHTLASDVKDSSGKVIIPARTIIDTQTLKIINDYNIDTVNIRSVLTCEVEG